MPSIFSSLQRSSPNASTARFALFLCVFIPLTSALWVYGPALVQGATGNGLTTELLFLMLAVDKIARSQIITVLGFVALALVMASNLRLVNTGAKLLREGVNAGNRDICEQVARAAQYDRRLNESYLNVFDHLAILLTAGMASKLFFAYFVLPGHFSSQVVMYSAASLVSLLVMSAAISGTRRSIAWARFFVHPEVVAMLTLSNARHCTGPHYTLATGPLRLSDAPSIIGATLAQAVRDFDASQAPAEPEPTETFKSPMGELSALDQAMDLYPPMRRLKPQPAAPQVQLSSLNDHATCFDPNAHQGRYSHHGRYSPDSRPHYSRQHGQQGRHAQSGQQGHHGQHKPRYPGNGESSSRYAAPISHVHKQGPGHGKPNHANNNRFSAPRSKPQAANRRKGA